MPPLAHITSPVTHRDLSSQRKTTMSATSPSVPALGPAGVFLLSSSMRDRCTSPAARYMSVSTGPGFTALTVTPCLGPSSVAQTLVSPSIAALEAEYTDCVAYPPRAEIDDKFTIRPPHDTWRTKACVMKITALTLTSITLLYSSTVISPSEVAADPRPALFTRMSRFVVSNAASVSDMTRSGVERSRLSACIASAVVPDASIALTNASACTFEDRDTYVKATYCGSGKSASVDRRLNIPLRLLQRVPAPHLFQCPVLLQ